MKKSVEIYFSTDFLIILLLIQVSQVSSTRPESPYLNHMRNFSHAMALRMAGMHHQGHHFQYGVNGVELR